MSIKDAFGQSTNKILTSELKDNINNELESDGFLEEVEKDKERFLPSVNFESPSNFARYGSAEKYYSDAIKNVYLNYPYDGSKKEKQEWKNNSSQFDLYVFENIYPKSTGYITLSGSDVGIDEFNCVTASNYSYIHFFGGPNNPAYGISDSIVDAFKVSNKLDISKNRASNLAINQNNLGNTIEFWCKADFLPEGTVSSIFNVWNKLEQADANYSLINILLSTNALSVKINNTNTIINLPTNHDVFSWNHYAISIQNKIVSNIESLYVSLYINGILINTSDVGFVLNKNLSNNNLVGRIGCNQAFEPSLELKNCFIGSIDEFRFWKECRTPQNISRFWFTSVGGGANTDDSNTELGVYFKFNEGISGDDTLDARIIDYSGRVSNGLINNYNNSIRSTSSAIEEYGLQNSKDFFEIKDPILYSSHPEVVNIIEKYELSGSEWDNNNNSNIYKSLPSWIVEEEEKKGSGDLGNLVQIISSYFDTLHIQIEGLPKLKHVNYYNSDKHPPFIGNILSSYGFESLDLFTETGLLENALSRNEDIQFEKTLSEIKNSIYQNIYNNLSYIYKSKGTEKSIRNLIRCFGIDDELVKINTYSDNTKSTLKNTVTPSTVEKKFLDFNDSSRFGAFVCNYPLISDGVKGYGVIPSLPNFNSSNPNIIIPLTLQAEIIFPKKLEDNNKQYTNFSTVSLFGIHKANSEDYLEWGDDEFNFSVYAEKLDNESKNVFFRITGSFKDESLNEFPFELTSSVYNNVYDNEKWNFAVRIKQKKYDYSNFVNNNLDNDFVLEFVGYNTDFDVVVQKFNKSIEIPKQFMKNAIKVNKRIYVGAHYQNYDLNYLLYNCDIKASSIRFWYDYLTEEEIIEHSKDPSSCGRENPVSNFAPYDINLSTLGISKIETLALNWDFSNVTTSDINGEFIVDDRSNQQYSLDDSIEKHIKRRFTGKAFNFPSNSSQVVNKEYLYSAKKEVSDGLFSSDSVQIYSDEDEISRKDKKPETHYYSIEKSMSQVINSEILKWFSSINSFNNLIGEPINKYKEEYSSLQNLRRIFFEQVGNTPDFERFLEFFKWIDNSISSMIQQLIPASANMSSDIKNVIEQHLLERNKYQNKVPLFKSKKPEIIQSSTSFVNYDYASQHAPASPAGDLWLKYRVNRNSSVVSSGDVEIDDNREIIRKVISNKNSYTVPRQYNSESNQIYSGIEDKINSFSNISKFSAQELQNPEDTINLISIDNKQITSKFIFAEDSITGSSQIIQYNRKKIGNFYNKYEYFQTSGRKDHNIGLADISQSLEDSLESNFVTGLHERILPTRPIIKTIFVERFSAPGGPETLGRGSMDATSEEYSVYNSINNRNLVVRKYLDKLYAETSSLDEETVSYHKVNKNNFYKINGNNSIKKEHDNNFIIHQIPRSDIQYSWITASVSKTPGYSAYFYNGKFDNLPNYNDDNFEFLSSSESTNYSGLNLNGNLEKIISFDNGLISPNTSSLNLNSYLSNINGPYQGASWKQTFKQNNKIARISRENNTILVQENPVVVSAGNKYSTQRRGQSFKQFKEPAVQFNNPIKHSLSINGIKENIKFLSSYNNNINYFGNKDLSDKIGVKDKTEEQVHQKFLSVEKNGIKENPQIKSVTNDSIIIPRKSIITLKEVRTKPNYDDNQFTGSVVNEKTFWRDELENRERAVNTYDMFELTTGSISAIPEVQFYMYNMSPTSSIVGNVNFRESISSTDVYLSASSSYTINTNTIQYDKLTKGNLYKNTLMEEKSYILNNIEYTMPNFTIYNRDNESFYSINYDIHPLRNNANLPIFYNNNSSSVCCTLSCSDGIYIGGHFDISGSQNIIKWNGSSFVPLASGLPFIETYYPDGTPLNFPKDRKRGVLSMISSSNGIYAAGTFAGFVQRWNGTSWTNVGSGGIYSGFPNMKYINTIISCSAGIIAGGQPNTTGVDDALSLFNGTLWKKIGAGFGNEVRSILSCSLNPSFGLLIGTNITSNSSVYQYKGNFNDSTAFVKAENKNLLANSYSGGFFIGGGTWSLVETQDGIFAGGRHNGGPIARLALFTPPEDPSYYDWVFESQLNDYVFTLKYDDINKLLYAGGAFTKETTKNIRLNGVGSWPMETGLPFIDLNRAWNYLGRSPKRSGVVFEGYNTLAEKVYSINIHNDNLFIGGFFSKIKSGPLIKSKSDTNLPINEGYEFSNPITIPHPQLVFNNFIPPSSGSSVFKDVKDNRIFKKSKIVILNDGYIRETEEKSGKKPFYDSFNDYSQDIHAKSQKYSILPEYRISDYVGEYIKNSSAFKSNITPNYLKLDGAIIEDGFDKHSGINISDTVDFNFVSDLASSNNELEMNIKVSGIKKLLPKKDFYPNERIITLSKYFIDSFMSKKQKITSTLNENNIDEFYYTLSNNTPLNGQILTLLQPLFAPGILLNTIKSSIAVDWPLYIANSGSYDSSSAPSFYAHSGSNLITAEVKEGTGYSLSLDNPYMASNFLNTDPSFRLPFEALFEFDSRIPASFKKIDKNLYYLNPSHYTSDILTGSDYDEISFPSYNMDLGSMKKFIFNDSNYQLAIHNFLAEIPNLFLQNGLNKFVSGKSSVEAQEGKTYYMDVVLEKVGNYNSFVTDPIHENKKSRQNNFSNGSLLFPSTDFLYGPPMRYWNSFGSTKINALFSSNPYHLFFKTIDSPAYAPYVPPYHYGKSIARISFHANDTRQYSVSEIIRQSSIEYLNEDAEKMFKERAGYLSDNPNLDNYSSSPAFKNLMNINSSVNLKQTSKKLVADTDLYDSTVVRETDDYYWVIQTKFETPSINFANVDKTSNLGLKFIGGSKEVVAGTAYVSGVYSYLFKGIWTSYSSEVSNQENGIILSIQESPEVVNGDSLIQLCDFKAESKLVGGLANNKTISEGVVLIPFTSVKNNIKTGDKTFAITNDAISGEYSGQQKYYFQIDRKIITKVLGLDFSSKSSITYEEIKKKLDRMESDNSIIKLMKSMTKYVIPPHIDWLRDRTITPFVMYVFDFEMNFSTEDLSDIWQGVMPQKNIEEDSISINHPFSENELFHGKKLPSDIKFKTFKVKQKANINYYTLTEDSRDDTRFKFKFGNSEKAQRPEYSYNWPYDFCSIVEYVSVEAGVDYVKKDEINAQNRITGQQGIETNTNINTNQF